MKSSLVIVVLVATSLWGCATNKEWAATGGSRSDGIVKLSYEQHELEQPILNEQQAINIATKRCNSWGYSGAEAFGGHTRTCNQFGGLSGCARFMVTKEYQCINNGTNTSFENIGPAYPTTGTTPVVLGVQYISVSRQVSDTLKMKSAHGAYVVSVLPNSAAEKSGMQQGDVILRIGDKEIMGLDDIQASLMRVSPKSTLPITIWRNKTETVLFASF